MAIKLRIRKRQEEQPAAASPVSSRVRDFTLSFFTTFGAQVEPLGQDGDGAIQVTLPPGLAAHFGKAVLRLVFQKAEATGATDLVAYGSRIFDAMMAYLEQQSALTVLRLPVRYGGADALLHAVHPRNAAIAQLKLEEEQSPLFVFNWHITYRADDRREEIFTVVLDEHQRRIPLAPDDQTHADPSDEALHLSTLLADAEPFPEPPDQAQPLRPPKLPPMTQLSRLAETARKVALYHADVRCAEHEREILPRLHKVLTRLTTYYQQQIEEVYEAHDPTGEKRRLLEEDLQRKIGEEVENHRLHMRIRLFSYAILYLPLVVAHMTLRNGSHDVDVAIVRNRYTGAVHQPRCHVCREEMTDLLVDRHGHVTCDACMALCGSCQAVLCARCGLSSCPVCGRQNCEECSRVCWACGERACADHLSTCPVCADAVCHACQAECAHCGVRQCRTHLRIDSVSGDLICGRCAVRCPGCQQYSSHLVTCDASGQQFCRACAVTCHGCGRTVGPGFYTTDRVTGQPYCQNCLEPCPNCGSLVATVEMGECTECAAPVCSHCGQLCAACHALLCPEHVHPCDSCHSVFCGEHVSACVIGGEQLCPDCQRTCAICERPHCQQHSARCEVCLQIYCSECVRRTGLCETCAALSEWGVEVAMAEEPIVSDVRVANLMHKYRWIRHANRRYVLYLGANVWGRQVLVVVEAGKVLHIRRSSIFGRRLGLDYRW